MGIIKFKKSFQKLSDPPKKIRFRGDLSILNSQKIKIAIIGSRRQSRYGFSMLDYFFEEGVFENACIVTGGAYGTDIQACKLAIEHSIPLIVFLASGVNNYTPKRYRYVFEPIPPKCLLVSENTNDYIPKKYDFVKRNRLIAAVSDLIYINEASSTSGSLHTSEFGLQMGKDIACLPGRITDSSYLGCLKLIQNGAHCINNKEDLFNLIKSLEWRTI